MTPRRVEPATEPQLPGWRWLWFAALGGQIAWAMAVLVAYPLVQAACELDARVLVHLPRWTAGMVAAGAAVAAFAGWRRAERLRAADLPQPTVRHVQRARLMCFAGLILNAAALLLLLVEDLATWVIDPCL